MIFKGNVKFLICILSIISIVSCNPSDIDAIFPEDPSNFETEMGADVENVNFKSFKETDPDLKSAFILEYEKENDKEAVFEKYYNFMGPKALLDFVENKYPLCHSQSHGIGKEIYKNNGDIIKSLHICKNRCTNGCMHGVVKEAYGNKDLDTVVSEMKKFCSDGEITKIHKPGNCAHAMGHALMLINGYDLEKSLSACSEFDLTAMGHYCATGVYMEYNDKLNLQEKLELCGPVERTGLHYPCDTYNYPLACYRNIIYHIRKETQMQLKEVVNECLKQKGKQRLGCFHGLGFSYSRMIGEKPLLIRAVCQRGNREERLVCIEGAIEKLADFNEEQALKICNALRGEDKEVCVLAAKEKMYRTDKPLIDLYVK